MGRVSIWRAKIQGLAVAWAAADARMSVLSRFEWPQLIRSGLVLSAGNVAGALLSLARNVIIARLISVEDFGIASTLALTMGLAEMASNLALDRLLVQARDGEDPRLLSTLHLIQAVRGVLSAGVLLLIAHPVASLFGVPDVAWAYQVMAVIPLMKGLSHLDLFRRQRDMQFLPKVTVDISALLLSSVAALPLALALGDYRAMLYVMLIHALVVLVASHWVAVRPYRWGWDRDVIRRAASFGWPLILNGFLMFGIFQGDRVIVGSLIGMEELGWFSAAFSLTLVPALVLISTINGFFLPQLSQVQDDQEKFSRMYPIAMQGILLSSVLLLVLFLLLGPAVLLTLYGARYEAALPVLILLGAMQALRMFRTGPTVVAMSRAETTNPLLANIVRALALPAAALVAWQGGGVNGVILSAIAGEFLAFMAALLLLRYKMSLKVSMMLPSAAAAAVVICLVVLDALIWPPGLDLVGNLHIHQSIILVFILFMLWHMGPLRHWLRQSVISRPPSNS